MITLTPAQEVYLDSIADTLVGMGFDLVSLGGGSWSVNGIPAIVGDANPSELIMNIISNLEQSDSDSTDELVSGVALSLARQQAIKSGRQLTVEEMEKLMSDLFALPTPTYTPDGHLIVKIIDADNLLRSF